MLYKILKPTLGALLKIIFRPKIINGENLCVDGKAIIVCNHVSMADPFMLALACPRNINFMAKSELFESPIKRAFFKAFNVFPVKRKEVDMASVKQALSLLDEGHVFGIFPEGKRSVTGETDEFERGTAFMAIRANAPVIPVYICYEGSSLFHCTMVVGKPIDIKSNLDGVKKSAAIDIVNERIERTVRVLREQTI